MGIFMINAIEKLEVWTEKEQSESRNISTSEVHWKPTRNTATIAS